MVFEAASIGLLVPAILDRVGSATVLAAFERSFYLDTSPDLIAIGAASLHDGPLNILLGDSRPALTAALGIVPGQRWTIGQRRLRRDDGLSIDLETASTWRPAVPAGGVDRDRLTLGLDHLRTLLVKGTLPEGGLIRLCQGPSTPNSPVERAAAGPLRNLAQALKAAFVGSTRVKALPAIDLLGLGPGLTPSGDDVLAGSLLACHRLGEQKIAQDLGTTLLTVAAERTPRISQAHLRAAALGYGAAPLHDLLAAILDNDHQGLDEALDAAAKIGHSSGFDAVGGIILTVGAWLGTARSGRSSL